VTSSVASNCENVVGSSQDRRARTTVMPRHGAEPGRPMMERRWRERAADSLIAPLDVAASCRECNLSTTRQLSGSALNAPVARIPRDAPAGGRLDAPHRERAESCSRTAVGLLRGPSEREWGEVLSRAAQIVRPGDGCSTSSVQTVEPGPGATASTPNGHLATTRFFPPDGLRPVP
jgi:hypothetical protein